MTNVNENSTKITKAMIKLFSDFHPLQYSCHWDNSRPHNFCQVSVNLFQKLHQTNLIEQC